MSDRFHHKKKSWSETHNVQAPLYIWGRKEITYWPLSQANLNECLPYLNSLGWSDENLATRICDHSCLATVFLWYFLTLVAQLQNWKYTTYKNYIRPTRRTLILLLLCLAVFYARWSSGDVSTKKRPERWWGTSRGSVAVSRMSCSKRSSTPAQLRSRDFPRKLLKHKSEYVVKH